MRKGPAFNATIIISTKNMLLAVTLTSGWLSCQYVRVSVIQSLKFRNSKWCVHSSVSCAAALLILGLVSPVEPDTSQPLRTPNETVVLIHIHTPCLDVMMHFHCCEDIVVEDVEMGYSHRIEVHIREDWVRALLDHSTAISRELIAKGRH